MNSFINNFDLTGKKAIVTGGAKGLCNGMAQARHDAGAEVVLLDIMDMVEDVRALCNICGDIVRSSKFNSFSKSCIYVCYI